MYSETCNTLQYLMAATRRPGWWELASSTDKFTCFCEATGGFLFAGIHARSAASYKQVPFRSFWLCPPKQSPSSRWCTLLSGDKMIGHYPQTRLRKQDLHLVCFCILLNNSQTKSCTPWPQLFSSSSTCTSTVAYMLLEYSVQQDAWTFSLIEIMFNRKSKKTR